MCQLRVRNEGSNSPIKIELRANNKSPKPHLKEQSGFSRPMKNQVQDKTMDNNDWLKQLLMVGVGTTSLVAEKIREVSDEWVKDGKINPEQAKGFVDDMVQQIKSEQGNLEANMERQLRNLLQDLGVPRQTEMDELRGRIDRLERQVRDLENKLWR